MALPPEVAQEALDEFLALDHVHPDARPDGLPGGVFDGLPTSARAACAMAEKLGVDKADSWRFFAALSLQDAWDEYSRLTEYPAHERPRELMRRAQEGVATEGV